MKHRSSVLCVLGYFARLQLDESVREIVSPTTKGLIRWTLFCRPLHRPPNKCGCKSDANLTVQTDTIYLGQNGSNLAEPFGMHEKKHVPLCE